MAANTAILDVQQKRALAKLVELNRAKAPSNSYDFSFIAKARMKN